MEEGLLGSHRRLVFLGAALICFSLAVLVLTGTIAVADLVARLLIGAALAAVGTVWLGALLGAFSGRRPGPRGGSRAA